VTGDDGGPIKRRKESATSLFLEIKTRRIYPTTTRESSSLLSLVSLLLVLFQFAPSTLFWGGGGMVVMWCFGGGGVKSEEIQDCEQSTRGKEGLGLRPRDGGGRSVIRSV